MIYSDFKSKEEFIEAAVKIATPFIGMFDFEAEEEWTEKESALYDWLNDGEILAGDTPESIVVEFNAWIEDEKLEVYHQADVYDGTEADNDYF